MEQGIIKNVDIEDFKAIHHSLDYVDDDFVVVNSLEESPYSNETVRLNCFLMVICDTGRLQLDMNKKTYTLEPNDLIVCLPNSILGNVMMSPHYKIKVIGFSTRFLQRIIKIEKDTWNSATYLYKNPIKHISAEISNGFKLYADLIMAKLKEKPYRYHKEIVQYLFSALFCELLADIHRQVTEANETDTLTISDKGIKQGNHILKKFMEKVASDNGMHRSVTYFADELFYSPKYLSKVIKDTCGKTPLELINAHAIEHIKYRLKHSDKSIKEIAEEFNFSNQSFFGKYVKKMLGMSPQSYRDRQEE